LIKLNVFVKYVMFNFLFLFLIDPPVAYSKIKNRSVQYGFCPKVVVDKIVDDLITEFNEKTSLWALKKYLVQKNNNNVSFISDYKIDYKLINNQLNFSFDCFIPFFRVHVYQNISGEFTEINNGILVDNGTLLDPTYEILIKNENKLQKELPVLSITNKYNEMDLKIISKHFQNLSLGFKEKVSEFILNDDKSLIVILSYNEKSLSVFMGKNDWNEKWNSLIKIVQSFSLNEKIPSTINLINKDKVVVKFSTEL
jgi:hypothetical protein